MVSTDALLSRRSSGEPPREKFGSQLEYLLSVLGFAAGYGSVWRFPYLIYKNGGGVFFIPYFVVLFLVGIPSFYFETAIGQMLRRSPPLCFHKVHKKWKGFGVFSILLSLNMSTYYNLILAYSLYYLLQSFIAPLPWVQLSSASSTPWNIEYFYNDVLHASSGLGELGGIVWPLFLCYVASQTIVYFCIRKGVALSGKISLITATSPYILLFLLMLRGLLLPGAWSGLHYLFAPDWSKLQSMEVWVDAANQVIFQVSSGCGVLIIMGSYRQQEREIIKSSFNIPILTVLCGILASIVIFAFMGHMSFLTGVSISDMPLKGPDLAFIVFPAILSITPWANLLSVIFFIIMIFLGIDTQFAQVDAVAATIDDEMQYLGYPESWRQYTRLVVCVGISLSAFLFCSQAGFFYLDFVDNYSVSINLFTCIVMEGVFFFYLLGWDTIENRIISSVQQPTPRYMYLLMKYLMPIICALLAILAIWLQLADISSQPVMVSLLGWTITLYPYYFVYHFYAKYKDQPDPKEPMINGTHNSLELTDVFA